ncbi:hypothetical protein HDV00_009842 [Rhizophlyctis rosea]|nr:hypothetical protein HDV00_009842 [Rhizophlyctis rosea]
MDFCSINDFLQHILPHVNGPVAHTIKQARGHTATLVSTGSPLAVDITEQNAISAENASEQVRSIVESVREEAEEGMTTFIPSQIKGRVKAKYVKGCRLYLRGYSDIISRRRLQQNIPLRAIVPLTLSLIKFGIADILDVREYQYSYDDGFFYYVLDFSSREEALHIEDILKKALAPYCLPPKLEFVQSDSLGGLLRIETLLDETRYQLLMRRIFTCIVKLAHFFYPDMMRKPWPYGRELQLTMEPNIKAKVFGSDINEESLDLTNASLTNVVTEEKDMGIDMLPDYEDIEQIITTPFVKTTKESEHGVEIGRQCVREGITRDLAQEREQTERERIRESAETEREHIQAQVQIEHKKIEADIEHKKLEVEIEHKKLDQHALYFDAFRNGRMDFNQLQLLLGVQEIAVADEPQLPTQKQNIANQNGDLTEGAQLFPTPPIVLWIESRGALMLRP